MLSKTKTAWLLGAILVFWFLLRFLEYFDRSQELRPGSAPVRELNGEPRPTTFEVTADTEADLKALERIAQSYHHNRNGIREFEREETRVELEAILSGSLHLFHAKSLLATWHAMNGNAEQASEYRNAALEAAPVILTIPVRFGPDRPAKGVSIESLSIEHNRFTRKGAFGGVSIDPSINLRFINVASDHDGNLRLPVYNTVFRVNSWSHPKGLHADMRSLGWFKSKRREGILPTLWVWKPYSPASDLNRTAQQSSQLVNAEGTQETSLKGQLHTFRRIATAIANGSSGSPADRVELQIVAEGDGDFELERSSIQVLESRTKIPLHQFQSGAGFHLEPDNRLTLFSFWNPLPSSVDIFFKAYEYEANSPVLTLEPKPGVSATHKDTSILIESINAGSHQTWTPTTGFSGEVSRLATRSEVLIRATSESRGRWDIWIVDKSGAKYRESQGLYHDPIVAPNKLRYFELSIGLDRIDRIELRPQSDPPYKHLYFENIELPGRPTEELQDPMPIELTFDWGDQEALETIGSIYNVTSQAWAPIDIEFTVRSNQHIRSTSWWNEGYSVEYEPAGAHRTRPYTLYEWTTDARFDVDWELTLIGANTQEPFDDPVRGQSSGSSAVGSFQARGFDISPESVSAARLRMSPIESDE